LFITTKNGGDLIEIFKLFGSIFVDNSEANKNIDDTGKKSEGLSGIFSKLGDGAGKLGLAIGAGLAAAGAAVGAVVVQGVKATAELDEQLSQFQASTGATADEVEAVRKITQELYKVNTDSYEDIVATADALKKAMGMSVDEIEQYQQKYMDYAKTTGQANADVVGAIDDISDAWGLTLEESAKSMDMLKKSNAEYGTDLVGVQSALQNVAPAAKALGMSFEETNGYMNLFAASGLDASASVTAFSKAVKTVESPEQFKKMVDDIQAISDPTERAQKAIELFGSKAGISMANVLDGSVNLEEFIITMDEAAGTVDAASAAFDGNFNVQLELTKKMFMGLVQELGEKFMPALMMLLSWVQENIPPIIDIFANVINFIGGIIGELLPIFQGVFEAISSITTEFWNLLFGIFADNSSNISTSMLKTWEGIKNTLSAVWGFISDLAKQVFGALSSFWEENGEAIFQTLKTTWESIWEAIKFVWDTISEVAETVFNALADFWDENGAKIFETFSSIWNSIWNVVQPIWDTLSSVARTIFNALQVFWDTWGSNILTNFTIVFDTVKEVFGGVLDALQGLFKVFEGIFTGNWETMWEGVKQVFTGIWDAIEGIFKGAINFIINGINSFIEGINTIQVPDWVPGVGGKGINIQTIPLLANGGNIEKSGWTIVGDEGPELLHLNAGAQVRPLDNTGGATIKNFYLQVKMEEVDEVYKLKQVFDDYEQSELIYEGLG